jgi:hypothetical protein
MTLLSRKHNFRITMTVLPCNNRVITIDENCTSWNNNCTTLCCQFLWIVHFWLPLRYSLTFIWWYLQFHVYSSSFCVLCTLFCQFLWIVQFWLPLRYSLTFIWWYLQVHVYSLSFCVLCTQCCQFLWIVHFLLPLSFICTRFFSLYSDILQRQKSA